MQKRRENWARASVLQIEPDRWGYIEQRARGDQRPAIGDRGGSN